MARLSPSPQRHQQQQQQHDAYPPQLSSPIHPTQSPSRNPQNTSSIKQAISTSPLKSANAPVTTLISPSHPHHYLNTHPYKGKHSKGPFTSITRPTKTSATAAITTTASVTTNLTRNTTDKRRGRRRRIPPTTKTTKTTRMEMTRPQKRKRRPTKSLPTRLKGLKNFAIAVSTLVKSEKITTYSHVADQLVCQIFSAMDKEDEQKENKEDRIYEEKNIRRRVYDALNVMFSIGVIGKQGKTILWNGCDTLLRYSNNNKNHNSNGKENGNCNGDWNDVREMKIEWKRRFENVENKRKKIEDIEKQIVAMERLIERNRKKFWHFDHSNDHHHHHHHHHHTKCNSQNGIDLFDDNDNKNMNDNENDGQEICWDDQMIFKVDDYSPITFPFLVLGCDKDTKINLFMEEDHQFCAFHFNAPFHFWKGYDLVSKISMDTCLTNEKVLDDCNDFLVLSPEL